MNSLIIKKPKRLIKTLLIGAKDKINAYNVDRVIIFEKGTGKELLILDWDNFKFSYQDIVEIKLENDLIKKRKKDFNLDAFAFKAEKALEYSITGADTDIWISQDIAQFKPKELVKSFFGVEIRYTSEILFAEKDKVIIKNPEIYNSEFYTLKNNLISTLNQSSIYTVVDDLKYQLKLAKEFKADIDKKINNYEAAANALFKNEDKTLEEHKL